MQKTEKIRLDIDLIPEALYKMLVEEFSKTRDDVIAVNDVEITAVLEFEE